MSISEHAITPWKCSGPHITFAEGVRFNLHNTKKKNKKKKNFTK